MANVIAELLVEVGADISGMQRGLRQVQRDTDRTGSGLQRLGRGIQRVGVIATVAGGILAGALGYAATQAIEFDSAMTNARSVLGLAADEMTEINAQVLALGRNSVAGPQATAEAFYDIVSGVQDASTHMAILEAAIATAEAGGANLQATTSGLVSVMNAYGGSAEDAAHYSDVFTRTVGVGVGSMDEFVAALGPISGIASQVGVSFDEIGAAAALMTTKGFSAAQAGTRIQAAITALIKPNEDMAAALQTMGFESGEAAIQQLGLVGALEGLRDAVGGSTDKLAGALGTTEALGAALALTADDAGDFMNAFESGVEGATEAARAIQLESVQNQFSLLKSQVAGLAITVGEKLLPVLSDIVKKATPIVEKITEWIGENPELSGQLLVIAGAAIILGPALGLLGTVVSGLSGAVGLLLSPVALLAFAFGGVLALGGRLDDFLADVGEAASGAVGGVQEIAAGIKAITEGDQQGGMQKVGNGIKTLAENLLKIPVSLIENLAISIGNILGIDVEGGIAAWSGIRDQLGIIWDEIKTRVEETIQTAINNVQTTFETLWANISGPLEDLKTGIAGAFGWIRDNVIQPIIDLINSIAGAVQSAADAITGGLGAYPGVGANAAVVGDLVTSGQVSPGDVIGAAINAIGAEISGSRAAGGPVSAGGAYIVGEAGPELFVPRQSGRIVPNGRSASGNTYVLNAYGSSPYALLRDLERAAKMRGR